MTFPNDDDLIREQIEYYRRRAPEYDETAVPPDDPLAPEIERLETELRVFGPRGRVLELACGTGTWTKLLLEYATELTAVDSSTEMMELARRKAGEDRIRFIEADLFSWSPDRTYDVIFFANWLSHIPPSQFEGFWNLVGRALAPGGRVFFIDQTEAARRYESLRGEFIHPESTPLVWRTLRDEKASFRVVKVFWDPAELEAHLRALGWDVSVRAIDTFYWGEGTKGEVLSGGVKPQHRAAD
jgi:SAM-dependent methyltransferase